MTPNEFMEQCYLLGRYLEYYQDENIFKDTANSLIEEGLRLKNENINIVLSNGERIDPVDYLFHMTSRDKIYDSEDKVRCPILLYTSDPICYGILNSFIYKIASELDKRGFLTEIFDLPTDGVSHPERLLKRRFKAVIGFHTKFFSSKINDGKYFNDYIYGPKFLIILDHPGTFYEILTDCPDDLYVITLDENYKNYVDKYFPKVKKTFVIPPGGTECTETNLEKDIPLSFVGTYRNYRQWLPALQKLDDENKGLGSEFIEAAEQHPDLTFEEDLHLVIANRIKRGDMSAVTNNKFAKLFFDLSIPRGIILSKIREKIILTLLKSGLTLHVYGDCWKSPIFEEYENLIVHPELTPEESLKVFARSKVSLNIMSWHKAGMTERLSNIMLNHSLVATDESAYLRSNYQDNEDIIMFKLSDSEINSLPDRIKNILSDDDNSQKMAESTYQKALKKETWEIRTSEILNIIELTNKECQL